MNEIKIDEEKLKQTQIPNVIPRRYEQIWNCCKVKKGYSGTAVLSKVKPFKVQYDLGIPIHDGEGRSITLEYE
jgi:exodeoxyribonuclease-3